MSKVISFGIQKGGVGKTSVTAISAFLISNQKKKVLCVDFDSQGNLTQFLTQKTPYEFTKRTVFEACKKLDAQPYVHAINDYLHLLPAEDFLSQFGKFLYTEYAVNLPARRIGDANALSLVLRDTLDTVRGQYDYILIDLPPNLGEQTINGMAASDYAVVMFQCEPFCYDALDRYLETLESVIERISPTTALTGILTSIIDQRTALAQYIFNEARSSYGDILFETLITKRARIPEMSFEGIQMNTAKDREVLKMYTSFVEELMQRVGN